MPVNIVQQHMQPISPAMYLLPPCHHQSPSLESMLAFQGTNSLPIEISPSIPQLPFPIPPCSINSTPVLTTPTIPPVCTVSPPPPLKRCSISARPSSHVMRVCGGTSNFPNSSFSAVMMSANARPLLALKTLMVLRHEVTSEVARSVSRIVWMSEGRGAAMQS